MNDWKSAKKQLRQLAESDIVAALQQLEPIAAREREAGDIGSAIASTLQEAIWTGSVGDRETAFARATWAIAQAHNPGLRAAFKKEGAAFDILLSMLLFVNSGERTGTIPVAHLTQVLDAAASLADELDRPGWHSGVLAERANLAEVTGDIDEGIEFMQQAIVLRELDSSGPGMSLVSQKYLLAKLLNRAGRLEQARLILHQLLQDEALTRTELFGATVYAIHNALRRQATDELAPLCERALGLAEGMNAPQKMAAAGAAVEVYLALGDVDRADECARRVFHFAEQSSDPGDLVLAHQDAFDVAMVRGRLEEAQACLSRMEQAATHLADPTRFGATELITERRRRIAAAAPG